MAARPKMAPYETLPVDERWKRIGWIVGSRGITFTHSAQWRADLSGGTSPGYGASPIEAAEQAIAAQYGREELDRIAVTGRKIDIAAPRNGM